jgi:ribosomal protein L37AE/L43A
MKIEEGVTEEYPCPHCKKGTQTVSTNPRHFFCWNCRKWDYPFGEP